MTYNADSPNKAWSEAVCNSIKNTLGLECTAVPTVDFATYNKKLDAGEMKGIFRAGWQADYPSIENYLTPLYAKGAFPPGFQLLLVQQPGVREAVGRGGRGEESWTRPTACISRLRHCSPLTSRPPRSGTT